MATETYDLECCDDCAAYLANDDTTGNDYWCWA